MKTLLTNLECNDAVVADDISTDNSSTRSSFVSSETAEECISVSECEGNYRGSVVSVSDDEFPAAGDKQPVQADAMEAELLMKRNFRSDYIHRLTSMKAVQQPPRSKPHQTISIFDWDDTLFPTSFLSAVGFDKVETETRVQMILSKIDKCVYKLLQKALRVGRTYIVTNAMKNWVETSSEMYLPLTYGLISKNEISVVSARAQYEKSHPNDPKRWKQEAFLDIKASLEKSVFTNMIVAGDSTIELEAAQHVSKGLEQAILKTIKLKQGPSLEELSKQLETVVEKFDQIYLTLKNLAIKVERKN
jgi:hypothetical protein